MKKQNNGKKGLKWLLPVCILAVLALVGGILGFGLGSADKPAPVEQVDKIYWNVDGEPYRSQESTRFISDDGYIYMTFACEGEQMRVPVADRTLAVAIDALEVMGLVFDQDGVIVDYKRVEDFTDGIIANKYYVTSVEGNKVVCNSSVTLEGYDVAFEITENTGVWDVGSVGVTCGIPGTVHKNDRIIAVRDYDGSVSDVFVIPYTEPDDIYWNVDRKYDTTSKQTTREMDVIGTYTFVLACNGEQVTVRTRDYEIANAMDTMAARCFGLEFDENGYVTKVIHAGTAAGGGSCASWHVVEQLRGKQFSTFKVGSAATFSGTLAEEVKIFDVSGLGSFVGEPTQLRLGDTVHCLKDSMDKVCVVFVVNRLVDSEIYWNVDRQWDANTQLTTRTPDRDGWYRIKVAVQGKQITVKTQDKAIAQSIDGRAAKCFGLKLNADVIEKFYTPDAVSGGGTFASWYDITALENGVVTCVKAGTGQVRSGMMTSDCEIYNVSETSKLVGEVTQLRVGDRIHALKNQQGQINYIFVVTRFNDYPTYYNLDRQWDNTKQISTRTPDENGYYVFEMAYNGKLVTVKTKDKSIAHNIDSQAAKCVAMKVVDGIVYDAVHPSSTTACKGGPTSSYTYVTSISKTGFKTKKLENGRVTKTWDETFAPNCKVYNVSDNVISHKGEVTQLQVNDYVHCLKNKDGQVCLVYVLTRFEDLGVYYSLDAMWDKVNLTTTRVPDADGNYVFRMAHEGKEVTVKTASLEVANAIDSQAAHVVGLQFDDQGLVIKAIHAKGTLECKGGIGVSYATVTKIEGDQVTTEKDGKLTTFTISKNPNVFDVSKFAQNNQGERTTLRVGDFIHCLRNGDGKTHYLYVMSRVAVLTEVAHTCQHVTEKVTWYAWDGKSAPGVSGHYVLTQDAVLLDTVTIPVGTEITLCLDGHTVTSDTRLFKIYGTLNICDHKDGEGKYQGKLSSAYSNTVDENGKVTAAAYGALAYLYNSNGSSQLNIYGGNFEHTGELSTGGLVFIANKADNEKNTAVFSLYDGVLTGGKVTSTGGAVHVSNNGCFAMYGGTITDCSAASGGAVSINAALGTILMEGGTITNCTSTDNGAGIHVNSGSFTMTGGAVIGNTAQGNGGGVNVQSGQFVMSGGTLDGNTGVEGGNMRINKDGSVVLKGNAVVRNGNAKNGGNITMFGQLTVMDNALITAGNVTGQGSAISVFSNYDDAQVALEILGGTVDSAIRYDSNKGKSVAVYLLGGTVDTVNFNYNDKSVVEKELYVGGNVQVKHIRLTEGKLIKIHSSGLEDTASIGVSMTNTNDPFATVTDPADAGCFHAMDETLYKVDNRNNQLYLVSGHMHCVCGGHITNVGAHTQCDGTVQWTPWDGTTDLADGGHYYVYDADGDGKVAVSAVKEIKGGADVSICLNGVTLEGTGSRIFLLRGHSDTTSLNISDCHEQAQWGSMVSSHNGVAPLIHSYTNNSGPVLINIFGGNFRSTETTPSYGDPAGLIRLGNTTNAAAGDQYPGTMNLYAGNLSGGSAKTGGNLFISYGCTLNMYGGSITGGYASETGGNLYAYPTATLNLSGDVRICDSLEGGNLYLQTGAALNTGDLADTALVGITMDVPGQFTTVTDMNDAQRFTSDNGKYAVYNQEGRLSLVSNHKHCVCMGNQQEHSCQEDTFWLELTQDNVTELFTLVGSYYNLKESSMNLYLGGDVDIAYPIEVLDGQSLQLCLNGHTLSHSAAKNSTIRLHGDMSITDCSQDMTGTLTSNRKNESPTIYILNRRTVSSGVYTYHTPTLNLYAGNLTAEDQDASQKAGVLQVGNMANAAKDNYATFNMYGGKIYGGTATNGGNVYVETAVGAFYMYGGIITEGTASNNGGGVYVGGSSKGLYVSGTAVIQGNRLEDGTDSNVCLGSTSTAYAQLHAQQLEPDAQIYVSTIYGVTEAFGTAAQEADAAYIHSDKPGTQVVFQDGSLYFRHKHCICAGNAQGVGDHTACGDATFLPWGDNQSEWTKLPTSGSYYLTHDVVLSAAVEITVGNTLDLCLNGYTITGCGTARVFTTKGGNLNITDCGTTGTITNTLTVTNLAGGVIYMWNGSGNNYWSSTVNLYNGTLLGGGKATSGGVVYLGNKNVTDKIATFNMYGGTITGGYALKNAQDKNGIGGNVFISNHSVFNMYGGLIEKGQSERAGGNIYMDTGILRLLGGTVTNGTAGTNGQDVYFSGGQVILGGKVNVTEVFIPGGKTVQVSEGIPLTTGAAIGVAKAALEAIADGVTDQELAKFFHAVNGDWDVVFDDETDTLKLVEKTQ